MTARIEPPTSYRRWGGREGHIADPTGWRYPTIEYDRYSDTALLTIPGYTTGRWVHLGWGPTSTSRWNRASRHWHHGRLMGYPRRHVAAFVLRGLMRPYQRQNPDERKPT